MIINLKAQVEILNDSIVLLQTKQEENLLLLKTQINNTTEILKPIYLLKIGRTEVFSFVKQEGDIFNKMVALAAKEINHKISGAVAKNRIVKFLENVLIKRG